MEENKPKDQDDELKSDASGESQEESDDFGLPEASSDIDSGSDDIIDDEGISYGEDSDIFRDERAG